MSQDQVDQWGAMMRTHLTGLGYWQAHTLALSSLGMVVARHSAPSRVAEKCGVFGKADRVQRRFERFLANDRIDWAAWCRQWTRWVLQRYTGEPTNLFVDETKLGQHLSGMMGECRNSRT